jgi:hypothetical protein
MISVGRHYVFLSCVVFICTALFQDSYAQNLRGKVLNAFTKEPISFASVYWKKANQGGITDSVGGFNIKLSNWPKDTLVVSYVGYDNLLHPYAIMHADSSLVLYMKEVKMNDVIVVKSKFSKGLRWWKQIVANKNNNNPYRFNNYSYELYNKLELDITNISKSSFEKRKVLKPFDFILNNIDSASDVQPFLPVYVTEALSNYYYSKNPYKIREEIKAAQTSGIKNETVLQFVGGVSQKINCYENYLQLFGKEFISPLSDFGDKFYNYKGADTQIIHQQKYFHLFFTPKKEGTNTFTGDCWIQNNTWAIYKINLTASASANINFVHRLSVVQEFAQNSDSSWIFSKDKFVVDISPFNKGKFSFIGRKTATYKNVQIEQAATENILAKNIKREEVIVLDSAKSQNHLYWNDVRHEPLSANEHKVYQMIDTLKQMPVFKKYTNRLAFLLDGHKKIGSLEIGPWYKWISSNQQENLRLRFDLGTTEKFSNVLRLTGYAAYGTGDGRWKGKLGFNYQFNKSKHWAFGASYTDDLDNGRIRFVDDENITVDNMFNRILRRKGIVQKFLGLKEFKSSISKRWENNISADLVFKNTNYETFHPLPSRRTFSYSNDQIINSELALKMRFAPGEKQIIGARRTVKLKSQLPILELDFGMGLPGVLNSEYKYQKISTILTHNFRVNRWGQINYAVYGGKVYGNEIPFMLLEIHPGNEIYYYNKQSFNLMNRFEYISDTYAGLNIEHNFEKKLLNVIPALRKTNMRQFWNIKTVWGDINTSNRSFNRSEFSFYYLKRFRSQFYTELGTGVDNIFKFFRIDLVWRMAPKPMIQSPTSPTPIIPAEQFAVFGSFHFQF